MSIFIIVQQKAVETTTLGEAIHEAYPDNVYDLGEGTWLVSDSSTAMAVSEKIKVTGGESGSAVIIEAASYFGRANPAIWSWIKANWEGGSNG